MIVTIPFVVDVQYIGDFVPGFTGRSFGYVTVYPPPRYCCPSVRYGWLAFRSKLRDAFRLVTFTLRWWCG